MRVIKDNSNAYFTGYKYGKVTIMIPYDSHLSYDIKKEDTRHGYAMSFTPQEFEQLYEAAKTVMRERKKYLVNKKD